eukprot:TRINITY_DN23998_c0_g2_i2.p1 TRINITY_DN23998_c0_g2~~TRINITY_DN23998_c0_g2_i2.p1  ORF type:complete len:707 (+),score=203.63 TRINITY_DN23998_c0_g2_i2:208-2328(+)
MSSVIPKLGNTTLRNARDGSSHTLPHQSSSSSLSSRLPPTGSFTMRPHTPTTSVGSSQSSPAGSPVSFMRRRSGAPGPPIYGSPVSATRASLPHMGSKQGYLTRRKTVRNKEYFFTLEGLNLTRYDSAELRNYPKLYRISAGCECRIERDRLVLVMPQPHSKVYEYLCKDRRDLEDWAKELSDCIRGQRVRRQSQPSLQRSQSIRHCPGFDTLFQAVRTQKAQEIDISDASDIDSIVQSLKLAVDPSQLALSKLRDSPVDLATSPLDSIWNQFDADRDGYLNPAENEALVKAYFKAKQAHTPGIIEDTIESALRLFFKDANHALTDFVKGLREEAQRQVDTFYGNLQCRIKDVASEMWQRMDANKDGRVDRREFMQVFLDCDEVLYFDSAMRTSIGDDIAAALTNLLRKHNKLDPGICGLKNIGNTCYMNTAIQCLSATVKFRQFFLSGKYKQYINVKNRLGTKGKLATAFADMLTQMWKGSGSVFSPKQFKHELGAVNDTFSGYGQEDCHELISFLLDRLHEDLNYVTEKKYVELKDPPRATEDELASMWWEYHIKQNVGVVVSLFHGQLRSVVTCSKCGFVSKAFDPFMYLSVPVPSGSSGRPTLAACLSGHAGCALCHVAPGNGRRSRQARLIMRHCAVPLLQSHSSLITGRGVCVSPQPLPSVCLRPPLDNQNPPFSLSSPSLPLPRLPLLSDMCRILFPFP